MRRIRIEHDITDVGCLARVIDAETGNLLEQVVSLDLTLTAGEPVIKGILTLYVLDSRGWLVTDKSGEDCLTKTENVEIVYVDTFDQSQVVSQVAISE